MPAQKKAYIKDFITQGFPLDSYSRRIVKSKRTHTTTFQQGLNSFANQLQHANVFLMHPKTYTRIGDTNNYEEGEGPQYPDGVKLLKKSVNDAMGADQVTWTPEYLYLPAREGTGPDRAYNTYSSRSIFEYDPQFDLGENGRTARMGMLLFEDGGAQSGERDEDNNYLPGPGGPFFFHFGNNN
jgi:hypothetical protein